MTATYSGWDAALVERRGDAFVARNPGRLPADGPAVADGSRRFPPTWHADKMRRQSRR
jgi:hypothetical protein